MSKETRGPSSDGVHGPSCESAAVIFERIQREFRAWGMLGKSLSLEHQGVRYRVLCDEKAFMVYRVNDGGNLRHHVPGWPVCLVNSHSVFEECCSPKLGNDHYACGLDIEMWLAVIHRHCLGSPL